MEHLRLLFVKPRKLSRFYVWVFPNNQTSPQIGFVHMLVILHFHFITCGYFIKTRGTHTQSHTWHPLSFFSGRMNFFCIMIIYNNAKMMVSEVVNDQSSDSSSHVYVLFIKVRSSCFDIIILKQTAFNFSCLLISHIRTWQLSFLLSHL